MRIHRDGLFETSEMAGAIPSEYVFLHLHPDRAVERTRASGTTRGASILGLEETLFAALEAAGSPEQARAAYREFTHARDASYFRIEGLRGRLSDPAALLTPTARAATTASASRQWGRSSGTSPGRWW